MTPNHPNQHGIDAYETQRRVREKRFILTVTLLGIVALAGLVFWGFSVFLGWSGHVREWLNLLMRWAHVVIGIGWIGASFYFVWLENNLERENQREELAGSLWSVHGGGFYYIEKYKLAPERIPETLHWFKWEAYLTWLTGVCLLIIVYYSNAKLLMIDPSKVDLSVGAAIGIGIGTLIVGWVVYALLCRSPLVKQQTLFALVGFLLITALAYGLSQVLSDRAAYMHVGALLGTLMAGNVFFVIIPSQKALVHAATTGAPLNPELGKHAGLRSLHNNYITLPMLFIMLSNHFPFTFGHAQAWLILAGLFLGSASIRHYLNLHEKGREVRWLLPVASVLLLTLAFVTGPRSTSHAATSTASHDVNFVEVQQIVLERCASCHSAVPTQVGFTAPPKDIRLDTSEQIVAQAELIYTNSVLSDYMPLSNITNMTASERQTLGAWYEGLP